MTRKRKSKETKISIWKIFSVWRKIKKARSDKRISFDEIVEITVSILAILGLNIEYEAMTNKIHIDATWK